VRDMTAMNHMTHLDVEGQARMVDVSAKATTTRIAVAAGQLQTTAEVVALVRADNLPKADVLATARIAGISGAKRTSELIPLCHQLALSSVTVDFGFTSSAITIEAAAKTTGHTGVEMEALTAVAVAGLTLHDMVKAVDPAATLNGVRLLTKNGGKRGHWVRPDSSACQTGMPELLASISAEPLDPAEVDAAVTRPQHGAVVLFSGVVRNHDGGQSVSALEYQAHPDAQRFLRQCCKQVSTETGLPAAAVHRVGSLMVGDLALVAAVAAPHRTKAFAACTTLVERIKAEVPIWKRQHFADGVTEWVGL